MSQESATSLTDYRRAYLAGEYDAAAKLAEELVPRLRMKGDSEAAKELLANTISTDTSPQRLLWAAVSMADQLYEENQFDNARIYYAHAMNVIVDDPKTASKLLFGIGNTHFMEGNYLAARRDYENSLQLCRLNNLSLGTMENLVQLSEVGRALGEYERAEEFGREALGIAVAQHRKEGILRSIKSLCSLAIMLSAQNFDERSLALLQEVRNQVLPSGDDAALGLVDGALARLSKAS